MATTLRNPPTAGGPLQEPKWKWVQIPAYELDKSFLERRLQEEFGPWNYHVKFQNDWYTLRVPEDTTERKLDDLREERRPPPRNRARRRMTDSQ